MKQKLIKVVLCMSLVLSSVACAGGNDEGSITIMQNKVEIDAQLKEFARSFEEETDIAVNVKTCGGDACGFYQQLRADFTAGDAPDIFVIEGMVHYEDWKDYMVDLSTEPWNADTDVAFVVDGKTYGFPISIEGWGLAYNKDLLDKAGIDPRRLTNYDAYKSAFEKLEAMKDELGIDSVVSMAISGTMAWVVNNHNLNAYLANGLARDDTAVIDMALRGELDEKRFEEYAQWVALLFKYAEQKTLVTGSYDEQIGAFIREKAVFLHQGNWVEPNLQAAGAGFTRGFAPHGSSAENTDGIFAAAPSYYAVNKDGNVEGAKKFLQYYASSEAGHDYIVNKILAVPAFKSVSITPSAPLSADIVQWSNAGKTYAWHFPRLPEKFRAHMGAIYNQLAQGAIDLEQFIELSRAEFFELPSMLQ